MTFTLAHLLKKALLAVALVGLLLVPLWQSVGHANEAGHAAASELVAADVAVQDDVEVEKHPHHAVSDHAHDLPIIQLINGGDAPSPGDIWPSSPRSSLFGVIPGNPEQPPRSI